MIIDHVMFFIRMSKMILRNHSARVWRKAEYLSRFTTIPEIGKALQLFSRDTSSTSVADSRLILTGTLLVEDAMDAFADLHGCSS